MSASPADAAPAAAPRHTGGERFTVRAGAMVHGAVCLAQLEDGTSLLIDGAIPGELVTVILKHRKGRVWFAQVDEVAEPSGHRVPAPCPYYGVCGGCQLQHVDGEHQLALKEAIVEDALRRQGVARPAGDVYGMAEPWRYRWRGEFHVFTAPHGGDAELGFNRLRSWRPVAVEDCLIHHRRITDTLPALLELARTAATPALTALHLTAGEDGSELLLRPKPRAAVAQNDIDAAALANGDRWSTGATTLRWRGHTFRVTPEAFIQVNWMQMDVLYGVALQGLGQLAGATVVDAYAGIGVLACELAARGARVICIESNREAAALGVHNAAVNGRESAVRYLAAPVEDAIAQVGGDAAAVLLDPPRAGCDPRVTAWLALAGPPRVVYVSCDPATLARDLRILTVSGPYALERLDLVDMFPQTQHIECVAVLSREPGSGG